MTRVAYIADSWEWMPEDNLFHYFLSGLSLCRDWLRYSDKSAQRPYEPGQPACLNCLIKLRAWVDDGYRSNERRAEAFARAHGYAFRGGCVYDPSGKFIARGWRTFYYRKVEEIMSWTQMEITQTNLNEQQAYLSQLFDADLDIEELIWLANQRGIAETEILQALVGVKERGLALWRLYNVGLSLRDLGKFARMSPERVRQLIHREPEYRKRRPRRIDTLRLPEQDSTLEAARKLLRQRPDLRRSDGSVLYESFGLALREQFPELSSNQAFTLALKASRSELEVQDLE